MSDGHQPPGGEPVGSVGEEAAKLFGALSTWAREQAREEPGDRTGAQASDQAGSGAGERPVDWAGAGASARDALAQGLHEVGEHLATGSTDCRYCPVCQVIHVVRQTSPEVRAHLTSAAGSLMQAAAGLLATAPPPPRGPVERIDLDDDAEDWSDAGPDAGPDVGPGAGTGPEGRADESTPADRPDGAGGAGR